MSLFSLDPLNLTAPSARATGPIGGARDELALRRAATEFEALLLKQLTAALSPSEDDEDNLFGHGTGDGMYQQMFSEQMALAMARNGGVGLAETILQQMRGVRAGSPATGGAPSAPEVTGVERTFAAARAVRKVAAVTAGEPEPGPSLASALPNAAPVPVAAAALSAPAAPPAPPAEFAPSAEFAPTAESVLAPPRLRVPLTLPTTLHATSAASATPVHAPAAVALHLPVRGRISSQFGWRNDPLHGGQRQHGGLDIAAARGTPIVAAAAGKVVFAGRRGGYGNLVEIEHADGRRTRYAHAEKLLVTPGEQVEPGQVVATVGSTGRSTGPHVHFEVREHGAKVNPLAAVAKDSSTKRR
jgi:murein DD-endopeptidase MepM/ murein hydrolase activator NlpD